MALKDLYSKYYYDQNYNCAETMIRAGNEYYELGLHDRDMIAFGGFGADIQTGNTCGAILDIRCKHTIEAACDILEQIIEEYDSQERSMP